MTREQFDEKIRNLMADPDFAQKLKATNNVEEMAALFSANGIELSAEDIVESLKAAQGDGELKEEELEAVAGGGLLAIISTGISIVKGALDLAPGGKYSGQVQKVFDYWYKKGYNKGWWR